MNPDEALDLRALADVGSPGVARDAVRRFRRKIFTTGALVLLAALFLAGGVIWATVFYRSFDERIETAPGAAVGAVYSEDKVTVVLRRVARLDEGVGLQFLVAAPDATPRTRHFLRAEGVREGYDDGGSKAHDVYLVVAPPESGRIHMRVLRDDGCEPATAAGVCHVGSKPVFSFEVDLIDLGVPENIWSSGG